MHIAEGIGSQYLEQAAEVAARARGDELLGDQSMFGGSDVEAGTARARGYLLPGPAGELAAGWRAAAHCLGDGIERHAENIVQDEDDPLGRAELLQHDEQREPDSVVERDPVGWIGQPRLARCDELDLARVVGALPAGAGRLDLVQAESAGHHDQPSALVLDFTELRGHQARERFLHDVLGRADVAEHPECEIKEEWAVVLVGLADLRAVLFTVHAASFLRPAAPRSPARRGRAHVTLLTGRRSSAHCDNARPPEALVSLSRFPCRPCL